MRKIIVTSALTYANGPAHLGHMVEYIQTDIWHRFQNMMGNQSIYIGGNDAHGTPIMLRAQREDITPEALIEQVQADQRDTYEQFLIEFDEFCSTHDETNRELAEFIYQQLHDRGDISVHTISQLFDPEKQMFLPDRFVKGDCPKCGASDQYGDNCEVCGATYSPTELNNPRSVLSGTTPIEKESEHYFFELPHYEAFLKTWSESGHLSSAVTNKLKEWFDAGLQKWDISRDAPYFGFEIPNAPGKYFYVWLDAPVGYMSGFKHYCQKHPEVNFDEFWQANSQTELHHFIGKDIMYFHALFWPAMLHGGGLRTPTAIHTHGFLTVNGQKMSKSRGTFIKARTYLEHLRPEYLRYYYAAKLSRGAEDIDLSFEDFRLRVNSDLIGKYINIASRTAGFIVKKFDGMLADTLDTHKLLQSVIDAGAAIAEHYEQREYNRAVREIMRLADMANQYIAQQAPWALAKEEANLPQVQQICSLAINIFRLLTIYLKPVLPRIASEVEQFLNLPKQNWRDINTPLLAHKINKFKPLMQRIEEEHINALQEASRHETL